VKQKALYPIEKAKLQEMTEELCTIIDDLLAETRKWEAPSWFLDSLIKAKHRIAILNSDAEKVPVRLEEDE